MFTVLTEVWAFAVVSHNTQGIPPDQKDKGKADQDLDAAKEKKREYDASRKEKYQEDYAARKAVGAHMMLISNVQTYVIV